MIRHLWTIPCRVAITDQDSNNVSLIEVLEELVLAQAPDHVQDARRLVPAFFDVVSLWSRGNLAQPETGYARSSLVDAQDRIVLLHETVVDLRQNVRLRTFGKILGLPVRDSGIYHLKVEARPDEAAAWQEVARVPIQITVMQPPEVQAGNGQPQTPAPAN
jgi:hypothetical protein